MKINFTQYGSLEITAEGITTIGTDAVVNAANEGLYPGSGVCGAIFRAADYNKLNDACRAIGHCDTGKAVTTPAFGLPGAMYIIHAVGPMWKGGTQGEPELLYNAYYNSLRQAHENACGSIGFPLISAGVFGYPKEDAWKVALKACTAYFRKHPTRHMDIKFAVPGDDNRALGTKILAEYVQSWGK